MLPISLRGRRSAPVALVAFALAFGALGPGSPAAAAPHEPSAEAAGSEPSPAAGDAGAADPAVTYEEGVEPHRQVDDIYRKFQEGYRTLDAAQVADLYTSDALYLVPNQDLMRGKGAVARSFQGFFGWAAERGSSLDISFHIHEREVFDDLVWDVGIYTLTRTDRDEAGEVVGEPSKSQGKFVTIAQPSGGAWRFRLDAYNGLAPAAPPQAPPAPEEAPQPAPDGP